MNSLHCEKYINIYSIFFLMSYILLIIYIFNLIFIQLTPY